LPKGLELRCNPKLETCVKVGVRANRRAYALTKINFERNRRGVS